MRFIIPVDQPSRSASVAMHFGRAAYFALYDQDQDVLQFVMNQDQHHKKKGCKPTQAVEGLDVNGVVTSGIGLYALNGFLAKGIDVYRSGYDILEEVIQHLDEALAEPLTQDHPAVHGKHRLKEEAL